MNTEEIINEIVLIKNLSKTRKIGYIYAVKHYEDITGMTLPELIKEAEDEEDQRIPLRRRRIKQHLLKYQQVLQEKNLEISSVQTYIRTIKSIYHYYELELPRIPPLKNNRIETLQDIPTREQIKQAINSTNNLCYKAIITFMASSGCALNETHNLTIQNFIDATSEYHNETSIINVINVLQKKKGVVPTFYILRQKTNIPYYTFCTPEAVNFICMYLKKRLFKEELHNNDSLFHIAKNTYKYLYNSINQKNMFGKSHNSNFFHSHAMRKYFATTLQRSHVDSLSVHFMLGHKIDDITSAYIKLDPRSMKLVYMKVMDKLCFISSTNYYEISSHEKRELELLRHKNKDQEQRLQRLEELLLSRPSVR